MCPQLIELQDNIVIITCQNSILELVEQRDAFEPRDFIIKPLEAHQVRFSSLGASKTKNCGSTAVALAHTMLRSQRCSRLT